MSRAVEAIKLLRILEDTHTSEGQYIKMSEIKEKLKTDDRNIRNIVGLLRSDLGIDIKSKRGHDGGYKLNKDIYKFIFNLSNEDLFDFSEFTSIINEANRSAHFKHSALKSISKVVKIQDNSTTNRYLYDIDFLKFAEETKKDSYKYDLKMSYKMTEPFHINVVYKNKDDIVSLDSICIDKENLGGIEIFIVLDLKLEIFRFIDLRYVQSTSIVYGDYDYDYYFNKITNKEYDKSTTLLSNSIIEKEYATLKIIGKLSQESIHGLRSVLGDYANNLENTNELLVSRSFLPKIFMLNLPELLNSSIYGDLMQNSEELIDFFNEKYDYPSPIILDQQNYIDYMDQFETETSYEDEDEFIIL